MKPETLADIARHRSLSVAGRRVDVGALRVIGEGEPARLTPKALGVLLELAREPGITRTREELLERVWGDGAGGHDVLTQAVKELRRVFGEEPNEPRFIETVPRLGYRLLADVCWDGDNALAQAVDPPAAILPAQRPISRLVFASALAAAAALLVVVAWFGRSERNAAVVDEGPLRAEAALTLTTDPGAEIAPRVSPDGARVAYVAADLDTGRGRVHLRSVAGATTLKPTRGEGDESAPVWSADGSELAFRRVASSRCELVTVPALGGNERHRGTCEPGMTGDFDWSPDGEAFLVAVAHRGETARLGVRSVAGGETRRFDYAHDPNQHDLSPRYSPDGRQIAFKRGLSPYFDLYVVDAGGGAVRRVTRLGADIRGFDWLPNGRAIMFASDHEGVTALYAVDADGGNVRALGVQPAQAPAVARHASTAVYEVPRRRSALRGIVLGEGGAPNDVAASTGSDTQPALSPDGTRVAFVSDRSGRPQLWLYDAGERQAVALTDDTGAQVRYPEWNAAGTRLVVTRRRNGIGQLVEIELSSQTQHVVSPPQYDVRYGTYAPNEGFLAVVQEEDGTRLVRLGSGASAPLARNVAWVAADADGGDIYYSRPDGQTVYRLAPADAQGIADRAVATVAGLGAWRVAAGAVWYFDVAEDGRAVLRRHDLPGGADTAIWVAGESVDRLHFSLGSDARRMLVTGIARDDTDIGLLRIVRDR